MLNRIGEESSWKSPGTIFINARKTGDPKCKLCILAQGSTFMACTTDSMNKLLVTLSAPAFVTPMLFAVTCCPT
jgi:hypothetical protein